MLGMVLVDLKKAFDTVDHLAFSVINLSCMGSNRGNSSGSNANSLTERNTVV